MRELYEMPISLFSGKELQDGSLHRWIRGEICTPGLSLKTPRKTSEKDRELENLLRSAVRLRNAQKRAVRTKIAGSKGNRKAR